MKISSKIKLAYGTGNLGYGTIAQTVNNFIMFFGTSILGVSGSIMGLIIALSAFWDGLSDPIVGYISDRHKSATFGRRLGFLLIATIGMALCNILLWIVPANSTTFVKAIWLLICLLALETFNTLFATPYVALGIDLAPNYNEQSSIQGYKTAFFILGMVLPSLLMSVFMPSTASSQGQLSPLGYINMSYFTSTLALIAGAICILGTFKAAKKVEHYRTPPKEKNAFFKIFVNFFKALQTKNYGVLIIGYAVSLISAAFLTSVGMHLFTYSFHFNATLISILMAGLFVSAILSQAFWIYLSKRIDKKQALNISLIVVLIGIAFTAIVFAFRTFFSNWILFALTLPCIIICGFGTGALYSLPISMFADVITIDKYKTGENHSATYSSFMTLAFNIANALALLIIGILLDIIKFNPSEPVQSLKVQNWLGIIVFGGCAISIGVALAIFSKYKLKRADVLKAEMRLKQNKEK